MQEYHNMYYFCIRMNKIKENIIRTGLKQFKHFGIKNVSIDDICAELKISKKTFYQFFNTKETFIAEVIDSHHLQHIRKFEKSVKGKNAIEVFLHTIKEVKKSTHDHPNVFWHDLKKYYPRLYEQYEKLRSNAMEM